MTHSMAQIVEQIKDCENILKQHNLYNDKIIYRYDVDTQKTETFFEFKKQDKFQPKVYYINQ